MSTPCPVIFKLTKRLEAEGSGCAMVEAIASKMRVRSQVGFAKYGTTLARDDLTEREWLHHAQEEALDLVAYFEALQFHHGPRAAFEAMQVEALAMATALEAELQAA